MKAPTLLSRNTHRAIPLSLALIGLLPCSSFAQGSIEVWGSDFHGLVSGAPGGTDFEQLSAGNAHCVALRTDGSIVSWGDDTGGAVSGSPTGTGFTAVAAGNVYSLALRTDGSLHAWGSDFFGQVSGAPTANNFTQITAGESHCLALRSDGSIVAWGSDLDGQVLGTPAGAGYVAIEAGGYHSLALAGDGSIVSWGNDLHGQVTDTPSGTGFLEIAGGELYSAALRADGSIVVWGELGIFDVLAAVPPGTGYTGLSAGLFHCLALRADKSVVAWGSDSADQVLDVPGDTGFSQVVGSWSSSIALHEFNSGAGYCFGDGTGILCPCFVVAGPREGCPNSSGNGGATLIGAGHAQLSSDTFRLHVAGVPGNKPGLILRGSEQVLFGFGTRVGDGLLCAGGQTARSHVQSTTAGSTTFTHFQGSSFGSTSLGAGAPTNYQFWYRDAANTCSGEGFNFSNAWTVQWLP